MYNNYFPYGNNPYFNQTHIVTVNGEQGAQSYPLAPNSDIVLVDTSQPIIWIKKTDGNGNASVTPYDISLHIQKPQPTNEELLAKINGLEEELNNVKSNNGSGNWKQQQSNSKPNSNK